MWINSVKTTSVIRVSTYKAVPFTFGPCSEICYLITTMLWICSHVCLVVSYSNYFSFMQCFGKFDKEKGSVGVGSPFCVCVGGREESWIGNEEVWTGLQWSPPNVISKEETPKSDVWGRGLWHIPWCIWCYLPPHPMNRRMQKHYHLQTSFAGGIDGLASEATSPHESTRSIEFHQMSILIEIFTTVV